MDAMAVSRQKIQSKILTILAGVIGAIALVAAPVSAVSISGPTDCDNNAIIHCGVSSTSVLLSTYQSSSYVQAVYRYFGISATDINSMASSAVVGTVTKTGEVIVNGKTVATGAITAGRTNIGSSTKITYQGATFYVRPPSVSFAQSSLSAYVLMSNGQFHSAVLASCGNPVKATPVAPPAPAPAPQPKPAPTPTPPQPTKTIIINNIIQQQQQQQQQVVVVNSSTPTTQQQQQSQGQQQQTVQTQPAAKTLPDTGPGQALGLFVGSTIAGTAGWQWWLRRRMKLEQ